MTVPAPYINQPSVGYLFLALMPEEGRRQIAALLEILERELPGVVWPMPPEALHITLVEIIQSRKQYSFDKDEMYKWDKLAIESFSRQILLDYESFVVNFEVLEASKEAITVQGTDGGEFADIRRRFVDELPIPEETKAPPDIVHSSIARYLQAVDLELVQQMLAAHPVSFEVPITEFRVVRTSVPPLLKYRTLQRYVL